ncbi:O-methyltransferase [Striga asiatica]|uniref:O-methyltransferase n=1 Tax=Striga asiatica TaxID=4170 RepID=A0A5A7QDN2_STRAF|nr:O-methyltransferase [Striga asiatica]
MALPNGINSTQELLDAQAQIWSHTLCFVNFMSLQSSVELGIFDAIYSHGRPITLSELTDALVINKLKSSFFERLVRVLVNSKLLTKVKITDKSNDSDGYWLTPASRLLLRDEPLTMIPCVRYPLNRALTKPWHYLSRWFTSDEPSPFTMAHGATFWELAARDPELNRLFNEGMASDARLAASVIVRDCGHVFRGMRSMVDVAGGTGTMAKAFADAFPELECSVLDLPHVVEGLEGSWNLRFVGGDMFESIPRADAVFMKWILHDWSDEDCVKIMKRCKEAIPSRDDGGKVIIIDIVVDDELENEKKNKAMAMENQLFWDIEMMVMTGGKERTEKEWAKLFCEAGFTSYEIARVLGLRSVIQVYP